ncbi:MAG: hypothetical protein ABFD97_18945 [Syntrophobacter sp.]
MTEHIIDLIGRGVSAAIHFMERLAGYPEYRLQPVRVRVPDYREVVHAHNRLRRSHHLGPDRGSY